MAVSQTSKVLFFDPAGATATARTRTTSRGTSTRITLDIKADKLGIVTDPRVLGRDIASGIADAIRAGIRAIGEAASADTQLKRKYAASALERGAAWATRRYAGGRTGVKAPNTEPGGRLFNDSGRLADGIVARATRDGNFTINVPKSRLDPSTFSGGAFEAMFRKLVSLVGVLREPASLGEAPQVRAAMENVLGKAVSKVSGLAELSRLIAALGQTTEAVAGLVDEVEGEE